MACQAECEICAELRAAMLELVGERDAAAVDIELLAERSGRSPAVVNAHYPSAEACLHDTYERLAAELQLQFLDAFAQQDGWRAAYEHARRQLLERLASRPAEARLCFVETISADRELQRRRDSYRRCAVRFLADEHRRDATMAELSDTQFELLVGAEFQAISRLVAAGGAARLPALEPALSELTGAFIPAPA